MVGEQGKQVLDLHGWLAIHIGNVHSQPIMFPCDSSLWLTSGTHFCYVCYEGELGKGVQADTNMRCHLRPLLPQRSLDEECLTTWQNLCSCDFTPFVIRHVHALCGYCIVLSLLVIITTHISIILLQTISFGISDFNNYL